MGRRIPTDEYALIHPVFSLSLFFVGMAATIAIIAGLCGGRFRRKSSPPPSSSPGLTSMEKTEALSQPSQIITPAITTVLPPPNHAEQEKMDDSAESKDPPFKELPLPPKMQQVTNTCPSNQMKKSASERKLSSSFSVKVSRSLSVARIRDQRDGQRKKGKLKSEESIWTKTIILGEKCKVPDEEDDAVVRDGKGNRVSTYHPKNTSSMSMSRQASFNERDSTPSSQEGK